MLKQIIFLILVSLPVLAKEKTLWTESRQVGEKCFYSELFLTPKLTPINLYHVQNNERIRFLHKLPSEFKTTVWNSHGVAPQKVSVEGVLPVDIGGCREYLLMLVY